MFFSILGAFLDVICEYLYELLFCLSVALFCGFWCCLEVVNDED